MMSGRAHNDELAKGAFHCRSGYPNEIQHFYTRRLRPKARLFFLCPTIVAPLAPERISGLVMLALLSFMLASAQGLPPTILQLIAPNKKQAQFTAFFMLVAVWPDFHSAPLARQ